MFQLALQYFLVLYVVGDSRLQFANLQFVPLVNSHKLSFQSTRLFLFFRVLLTYLF
jgi:hypothetical protein